MAASISIPEDLARLHGVAAEGISRSMSADQLGKKWVGRFKKYAGLNGTQAILDIGCGAGRMAIAIGDEFGFSNPYLGFDVDGKQIEFCQQEITSKHPGFRFIHTDLNNPMYNPKSGQSASRFTFPATDKSIDFCFATSVFTHMFTDEVKRYIKEAYRVVRPGGTFLSTWFCLEGEQDPTTKPRFVFQFRERQRYLGGLIKRGDMVAYLDNPAKAVAYHRPKAENMLIKAGFKDIVFHKGIWRGIGGQDHSQDVIVARRL